MAPIIENLREGEYFRDQNVPAGEWTFSGTKDLQVTQRFNEADADFTRVYAFPEELNDLEVELLNLPPFADIVFPVEIWRGMPVFSVQEVAVPLFTLFPLSLLLISVAAPETLKVNEADSIFAIVIHRAGVAASLAHNHLICASSYKSEAAFDPEHPEQARFRMSFPATALVVDDPKIKARWFSVIQGLGILEEPFQEMSEKDRQTVREHMLAEDQLDARNYPEISAELKALHPITARHGQTQFKYQAVVALSVHGKTVERPVAANIEFNGGKVHVTAVGTYRFTDFGIRPYSAFLGSIRNKDEFHIFVDAEAAP